MIGKFKFVPEQPLYIRKAVHLCPDGIGENGIHTVQEPDYKEILTDANLRRRMGRLLKMSSYAGLKTLEGIPSEDVRGIITYTGVGLIVDTIRFADNLLDNNEDMLNPSPFMQSTFNTVSGYIALLKQIRAYNTTYVQGAEGLLSAILDAYTLSETGGVLIGGFDEVSESIAGIKSALQLYPHGKKKLWPAGEGCGFMYVSREGTDDDVRLECITSAKYPLAKWLRYRSEDVKKAGVIKCSEFVPRIGAFESMMSVVLSICVGHIDYGYVHVIDDVNAGGLQCLISRKKQCGRF